MKKRSRNTGFINCCLCKKAVNSLSGQFRKACPCGIPSLARRQGRCDPMRTAATGAVQSHLACECRTSSDAPSGCARSTPGRSASPGDRRTVPWWSDAQARPADLTRGAGICSVCFARGPSSSASTMERSHVSGDTRAAIPMNARAIRCAPAGRNVAQRSGIPIPSSNLRYSPSGFPRDPCSRRRRARTVLRVNLQRGDARVTCRRTVGQSAVGRESEGDQVPHGRIVRIRIMYIMVNN